MKVILHVPATTSNLGPGFDALGMALSLHSTFEMDTDVQRPEVNITGYGAETLPRDGRNLVLQVASDALAQIGQKLPPVRLTQHNRVPLGSGLGSSSTAVVAGLALAQVLAGLPLDRQAILDAACVIEGHPDNAAPCVMGGLVTAIWDGQRCEWLHLPISPALGVVTCTPQLSLSTKLMRAALPREVDFEDAVHNGVHACMLIGALATGRLELLHKAISDRLHVPFRSPHIPGYTQVVAAAESAGALVATISGAGPTVIALIEQGNQQGAAVAQSMQAAFAHAGLQSVAHELTPRPQGMEIVVH